MKRNIKPTKNFKKQLAIILTGGLCAAAFTPGIAMRTAEPAQAQTMELPEGTVDYSKDVRTAQQLQEAINSQEARDASAAKKELVIKLKNSPSKITGNGGVGDGAQDLNYFPLISTIRVPEGIYIKLVSESGENVTFVRSSQFTGKGAMFDVQGSLNVTEHIVMSGDELTGTVTDGGTEQVTVDGVYAYSEYKPAYTFNPETEPYNFPTPDDGIRGAAAWGYNVGENFGGVGIKKKNSEEYINKDGAWTTLDTIKTWVDDPEGNKRMPTEIAFKIAEEDGFYYIYSIDGNKILTMDAEGIHLDTISEVNKEKDINGKYTGVALDTGRNYKVTYDGNNLYFSNNTDSTVYTLADTKIAGGIVETKYYTYDDLKEPTTDAQRTITRNVVAYTTYDTEAHSKKWTNENLSNDTGFFINQTDGLVFVNGATFKDFQTPRMGADYGSVYSVTPLGSAPIHVSDGAFTMNSGNIVNNIIGYDTFDAGCSAQQQGANWIKKYVEKTPLTKTAGAIVFTGGTEHVINGGFIGGNRGDAGAILVTTKDNSRVAKETKLTMNAGKGEEPLIAGNVGFHYAGGVGINPLGDNDTAAFIMNGGTFKDNFTYYKGGAVSVTSEFDPIERWRQDVKRPNAKAIFEMNGGLMDNNTAINRAGAIEIESDQVTLRAGRLTNNNSRVLGGAIYIEGDFSNHMYTVYIPRAFISENYSWSETKQGVSEKDSGDYPYLKRRLIPDAGAIELADGTYSYNNPLGNVRNADGSIDESEDGGGKKDWTPDETGDRAWIGAGGWTNDKLDYGKHYGFGGGVWLCAIGGYASIQYVGDSVIVNENHAAQNKGNDVTALSQKGGFTLKSSVNGVDQTGDSIFKNDDNGTFFKWGELNTGTTQFNATNDNPPDEDNTKGGTNGIYIVGNNARSGGGIASNGNIVLGENSDIFEHEAEIEFKKSWAQNLSEPVAFRAYINDYSGQKVYMPGYQFVLDGTPDNRDDTDRALTVYETEGYKANIPVPYAVQVGSNDATPAYEIEINGQTYTSNDSIWNSVDGVKDAQQAKVSKWNFMVEEIPSKARHEITGLTSGRNYVLIKEAASASDRDYNFTTQGTASAYDYKYQDKFYNYIDAKTAENTPYSWLTNGEYYLVSAATYQGPVVTFDDILPGKYYLADTLDNSKAYEFEIKEEECEAKYEESYDFIKEGDTITINKKENVSTVYDGNNLPIATVKRHYSIISDNENVDYVTEGITNSQKQQATVEKYVNQKVDQDLAGFDSTFTYDILAYIPRDVNSVNISDSLVNWLEIVDINGKAQSETGFDASKTVVNGVPEITGIPDNKGLGYSIYKKGNEKVTLRNVTSDEPAERNFIGAEKGTKYVKLSGNYKQEGGILKGVPANLPAGEYIVVKNGGTAQGQTVKEELVKKFTVDMFRLISENNHIGDGVTGSVLNAETERQLDTNIVQINGQNIKATIPVDSSMYGKWVQLTFNARIKPEYYNDVKNKLAETDRKVTYTNDNVHDIRWVEVGDSATSERYKTNINVQEAVLPHDGIGNKANYTLAYKNGYTVSKETNTVTVEPTTEQLKVTKIWAGDKASAPIDEEIKTAFLNALQLKLGSETVANHKFTIIEENKEENKWLIQSEVLPTYESKKYTVSEDLDSLKNNTADKIKKFFKYYSVTYSDSIDTGASPVSKSDVEAALKNSDGSTKLHDSTVTIPKGADRKIISQVNHGAGWVTAAEGDLKYLKEKYNINTAYRNDAYWGNGKSNPINIELNSLPTGTYFDITWRGNSFVDSATRKYVVINKDANASVRYSVYKQGAEGANTLANDLSNTSNGLALDVTDTQKTYVKIASSLTEAQLTEKITQSGRYLIVAENTSEHPVEIVLDENYTDGNLTDGGIIYNTQKLFEVKIRKTTDNGQDLSGAQFAMYKYEIGKKAEDSQQIALEENGAYFTSEKIEPGVYVVSETGAPAGYKQLEGKFRFTLKEDGSIDASSIVKENQNDSIQLDDSNNFTIRVNNTTDKTKLVIVKKWDDSDNANGDRPKEIKVEVLSDEAKANTFAHYKDYILKESEGWTLTIDDLTRFAYNSDGTSREINYKIREYEIAGYIPGEITFVKYAYDPFASDNEIYSATTTTNNAGYYRGYGYNNWSRGTAKINFTNNGEIIPAYCINYSKEEPGKKADYSGKGYNEDPVYYKKTLVSDPADLENYLVQGTNADKTLGHEPVEKLYYRLLKIAYYGYPNNNSEFMQNKNMSEDEFRLITANALFEYTDWYGYYNRTNFADKANNLFAIDHPETYKNINNPKLKAAYKEFMNIIMTDDFSMVQGQLLYVYTTTKGDNYQNLFSVGNIENLATITNIRLGDLIFRKTDKAGSPIPHNTSDNTAEFKLVDSSLSKEAAIEANPQYKSEIDNTYDNAYVFKGIKDGEYWLVETKAPIGFSIAEPIKVIVSHDAFGLIHVEFIGDSDLIINAPGNINTKETYKVNDLSVNNGYAQGSNTKLTAYCLQAKKRTPATTDTYTVVDGNTLTKVLDNIDKTKSEEIRQKIIAYAYFGPGGDGYNDFLKELLNNKAFKKAYDALGSDERQALKGEDYKHLMMYKATQAAIWDMTDNGNYNESVITSLDKGTSLYKAFKEAITKKTYGDLIAAVKNDKGYENVVIDLNVLEPDNNDAQVLLSLGRTVFSNYSFNYMDDFTEVELPSTGGKGTTIFYIVGAAAAAGAIVVLEARNKYKNSNKVA